MYGCMDVCMWTALSKGKKEWRVVTDPMVSYVHTIPGLVCMYVYIYIYVCMYVSA